MDEIKQFQALILFATFVFLFSAYAIRAFCYCYGYIDSRLPTQEKVQEKVSDTCECLEGRVKRLEEMVGSLKLGMITLKYNDEY